MFKENPQRHPVIPLDLEPYILQARLYEENKSSVFSLNPSRPTYIEKEYLQNMEKGFHGKPIDQLVILNFAPTITQGNTTRLRETMHGIYEQKAFNRVQISYIGFPVEFSLPEEIRSHIVADTESGDLSEIRHKGSTLITETVGHLPSGSTVGFLAVGNIGFSLEIVKDASQKVVKKPINGIYVGGESSFATINEPTDEPLDNRIQRELKEREAYGSTSSVLSYYLRQNILYIPPNEVSDTAPSNTFCLATSNPVTQEYISSFVSLQSFERQDLVRNVANLLVARKYPELAQAFRDVHTITLLLAATEGYFDVAKVGTWITQEQYEDAMKGVEKIADAALLVAKITEKNVVLTAPSRVRDYLLEQRGSEVYPLESFSQQSSSKVYIGGATKLIQTEYVALMAAHDINFQRTTQTNAYQNASIAGATNIIVTLPAKGFMDAERTDKAAAERYGLPHVTSESSSKEISDKILAITSYPEIRKKLIENQNKAVLALVEDKTYNFYTVLSQIYGLT